MASNKEKQRQWWHKNKERLNAQRRQKRAELSDEDRAKYLEFKKNEWAEYVEKNPNGNRGKHYKSRYGITIEDYERMYNAQGGVCAICKEPETRKSKTGKPMSLSVDHDHKTGKVRDLLCVACNHMVGFVESKNISATEVDNYIMRHTPGAEPYEVEADCG